MKKAIFYLLACVLLPVAASADEGMWLVSTFRDVIYPQMKKEGLKLKPGEIYNEESPALCNAIVAVDGHDGVAQRRGLLVVNLSGFEFQPLLLHLGVDHVPERADQPHAFVGRRRNREQDAGQQVKNRFFHRLLGLSRKKGLAYHKPRWCQRVCPSVLKVNFGSSSLSVPSLYFTGHTLALSSSFQIFASSHIDLT